MQTKTKRPAKPAKETVQTTAKSITLRNKDIVLANEAVMALAQMWIPPATAMKVRRLARVIGPVADDIMAEKRKLARQHAKLDERGDVVGDENGKIVFKGEDDEAAFTATLTELMDVEMSLEIKPLRASELADLDHIQPSLLLALGDTLEDDLD